MKCTWIAGLALLAGFTIANASEPFEAPSFVKELEDLDEVRADAASANKGVTFLLMEPGST